MKTIIQLKTEYKKLSKKYFNLEKNLQKQKKKMFRKLSKIEKNLDMLEEKIVFRELNNKEKQNLK